MRKPSTRLYELIGSLTKEEKKRVTIYLKGLGKKGEEHLRLFKAVAKQEAYDEVVLKKTFRGISLSSAKKRLYDLIMEVLAQIHRNLNIEQQLLVGLQYCQILFKKALYGQVKDELLRLKSIASKSLSRSYLVLIYMRLVELENSVFLFADYDEKALITLLDEIKMELGLYTNGLEYSLLTTKFFYYLKKEIYPSVDLKSLEAIMEEPLFENLDRAKGSDAKYAFCQTKMVYYNIKKELEKEYYYALEMLFIFESALIEIRDARSYMFSLYNVIGRAITMHEDLDAVLALFKKMEANNLQLKDKKSLAEAFTIELKSYWYAYSGNIEDGRALVLEHKEKLKKSEEPYIRSYFNFAIICFLDKNYRGALDAMKVVCEDNEDKYIDLIHLCNILKLVIYFELGEFSLLESLARSLYRKFYPNKKESRLELVLISGFRRMINAIPEKQKEILKELYEKMTDIRKDARQNEELIMNSCHIFQWVKSKYKEKPLVKLLSTDPYLVRCKDSRIDNVKKRLNI